METSKVCCEQKLCNKPSQAHEAFASLPPNSQTLLAVISFLGPKDIPLSLFQVEGCEKLPPSIEFCSNLSRLEEAIEALLVLSLIKKDQETSTFSLNNLDSTSFRKSLTLEQRKNAFNNATALVANAFPQRGSYDATLFAMWKKCAMYLPHVLRLKNCFREEHGADSSFIASPLYCDLNNMCQRYLMEISNYGELQDLIEVNTIALKTLPEEEQAVGLWGSLTSHKGQLLAIIGKPEEGVRELEDSYNRRSRDVPFKPLESTWAATNVGRGFGTLNKFDKALEWYEIAREHFLGWAQDQPGHETKLPADTMIQIGLILLWAGRKVEAHKTITEALESNEPENWSDTPYINFALGNVELYSLNHDKAEFHYKEAQRLWLEGGQLNNDVFSASCLYRLGCTALGKGLFKDAVEYLREALAVTDKRKDILVAEHARVLFKLSEALEQESGGGDEAREKREEAEGLIRKRFPDAGDVTKESTYDDLIFIDWR